VRDDHDVAVNIHLDTDLGGDPDDVCALAMLLAWPGIEITGITTNLDDHGERAGCVRRVLETCARGDLAERVVAGAVATMADGRRYKSTADDSRYWDPPVDPAPAPENAAIEALAAAIDRGDTIVTIGALTNLAALELVAPGHIHDARIVTMGGWVRPMAHGLPRWGPDRDFNIQCDTRAADIVLGVARDLTLVTLPAAATAHLRMVDLDRVRAVGPVGELISRQSLAYRDDSHKVQLATANEGLPDDLVNFHWDPLTAAIAAGWDGTTIEALHIDHYMDRGVLSMRETHEGLPRKVVVAVDGRAFAATWLETLERLR
jgi:purine nucleosidase